MYWKQWFKKQAACWWDAQMANVNAIQHAIPVKHVVIRDRRDQIVFWTKTVLGSSLALLLLYLAFSHGAPR